MLVLLLLDIRKWVFCFKTDYLQGKSAQIFINELKMQN